MSNLNNFKEFVKENPNLAKHVNSGDMTWQKFYEMYDMYGSSNNIWKDYIETKTDTLVDKPISKLALVDIVSYLKTMDIDKMQEGINSVQRVISVLQDFGNNKEETTTYKPRPIYKHFED